MKVSCYIKKYLAENLLRKKFGENTCNEMDISINKKLRQFFYENSEIIMHNNLGLRPATINKRMYVSSGYERYEISTRHFMPWSINSCHAHFCEMCWRPTQFFSSLQSNQKIDSFDNEKHIKKLVTKFILNERSKKEFDGKSFRERSIRFCDEHCFNSNYRKDYNYMDSFRYALRTLTPLLLYKIGSLKTASSFNDLRKSVSYFREVIYNLTRDTDTHWLNYLFMNEVSNFGKGMSSN